MSALPRTIGSTTDSRRPKGGGCMTRLFATVGVALVAAFSAVVGSNPWGP